MAAALPDWVLPAGWDAPARVHGLATTRRGPGVSAPPYDAFNLGWRAGDAPEAAFENRRRLEAALSLPARPHWLHQVHGGDVLRFDAPPGGDPAAEPQADAAVTSVPGVVLAILTADCLPVLFCSVDGDEVGGAHAGWKGLSGGILEATVAAMRTPPARLRAWLGPAAGPAAYEIGEEVRAAFVDRDAGAAAAFTATRPGHWRVDLYALARRRLADAGVHGVRGGDRCTISEPGAFYSYRRDGATGRMASLAWLAPEPAAAG